MDDIDGELDSFTEEMIRRNNERRKLLNDSTVQFDDEITDEDSDGIQTQSSNHSLDIGVKPLSEPNRPNFFRNDTQVNVEANSSPEEVEDDLPIDPMAKQVIENLAKLESERRAPLRQRLNCLARNYENSENYDYIDYDCDETQVTRNRSPTKTMRQTNATQNDSPPKKRLLLNERLNQIARTYDDSNDSEIKSPKKQMTKSDYTSPRKKSVSSFPKSPMKLISEPKTDLITQAKTKDSSNDHRSPAPSIVELQKKFITNEAKSPIGSTPSKNDKQDSPIRPSIPKTDEHKSPIRSIESSKQILAKTEVTTSPEKKQNVNLSTTPKAMVKTPKVVSNKISKMRALFEQKFGGSYVTNTAALYQQEVERRKEEVELLKGQEVSLPQNEISCSPPKRMLIGNNETELQQPIEQKEQDVFKQNEPIMDKEYSCEDNKPEEHNQLVNPRESIDNETAEQTVCDAFKDIESYSTDAEEELNDNLNFSNDSKISESKPINNKNINISPTKNRLYPDLNIEEMDETDPPAKPPRIHMNEQPKQNTTPMRTISFYRKELSARNSQNNTPVVVIQTPKKQKSDETKIDFEGRKREINEKIIKLQREIDSATDMARQASDALNLCLERDEFRGSAQRVEAEKLLLVSSQKRLALTNEIQRLKAKIIDCTVEKDSTKGSLTLRDLKLKIRTDFMVNKIKGNLAEVHHFVCVVSNGPNLVTTNVISTDSLPDSGDVSETYMEFQFGISFNDLSSNFRIDIQVYNLVTRDRELPHNLKYHIKKTPKKNKLTMKSPKIQSPGGPRAVLTTSFKLVGRVVINISNYHKRTFTLENFQFSCPLEGTLNAVSELRVSHGFSREGFLDVRDSSGCYSMRWVVLKGHHLAIYRFPEDTESKSPLMKIDLKNVINPTIDSIPAHLRHMVRSNSLALIAIESNEGSKGIFSKGGSLPKSTPKKFLMSAESRETCKEWSKDLSMALESIRIWSNDAIKPYSNQEFERLFQTLY